MFALPAPVRVAIATQPVNMRKSIDGLMTLVRSVWGEDVYSGQAQPRGAPLRGRDPRAGTSQLAHR